MDDYINGANSDTEAEIMHRDIATVLESSGMQLCKWCSNSEQMRRIFSETSNISHHSLNLSPDETTTSLGLHWCPMSDSLLFLNKSKISKRSRTKRELLSTLNSVFDPLGFLGPVLIRGKVFLQELWQLKIEWDDELPSHIQTRWRSFVEDLDSLNKLRIPRLAKINSQGRIELHGFCDASQIAFGACIYLRQFTGAGTWGVHLLCAKSRVAPTKTLTTPRLELSGALLLSEIMCRVSKAINISLENINCCCDSTVVLAWINGVPAQWKTYVGNRVTQIIENVGAGSWRHISTHQNPADPSSRKVTTQVLFDLNIWWYGPSFLNMDDATNPRSPEQFPANDEVSRELRPIRYTLMTTLCSKPLLEFFSSWNKLLRISAIWYRFFKWLRHRSHPNKPQRLTGQLQVSELRVAEEAWIVYAQRQAFPDEIRLLSNGDNVTKGPLKNLSPFLDGDILRVGGRLKHFNEPFSRKHPALLPRKHRVTNLIVEAYHLRFLHMGPSGMLANIHLHFWPLRGRGVVRKIVNQCQRCFWAKPIPMQPVMGQLPSARVSVSRPFTHTGVDFAGPITIKVGLRKAIPVKAYVAVFVCLFTKAVHLEAVSDRSADAFMGCLRRFISRRGIPSHICSDNGTNFVGTQRILRQYYIAQRTGLTVHEDLASEGLQWIFIPPGAPHFGGLWEAAVKSCSIILYVQSPALI